MITQGKDWKKLCESSDKETWQGKHQHLDAQTAELDSPIWKVDQHIGGLLTT